jgi:nucleoside 2-deoxyribosyltransferase
MRAYISVSFSKRRLVDKELTAIVETLNELGIATFIFVDNYQFDISQERQMMEQSLAGIDACDILVAETSDKAIGIGVETGYAKAKGKTIIYVRHKHTEHSTTVSGISDFQIAYEDTSDLKKQLAAIANKILKAND